MNELLNFEIAAPSRFERRKQRPTSKEMALWILNPGTPKEYFVNARSLTGAIPQNLSRAVILAVRAGAVGRRAVGNDIEAYWHEAQNTQEQDTDFEKQDRISELSGQAASHLEALLHGVADTEKTNRIFASFEEWLSEQSNSLGDETTVSFLDRAKRLDAHDQTDAALDIIFDQIDEMLLASKFDQVDQLLAEAIPDDLSVDLLLGILTATLPAKSRLLKRDAFFEQVSQSVHERGEAEEGLFVGLN